MPRRRRFQVLVLLSAVSAMSLAGCGGSSNGVQALSRSVALTAGQETTANASTATGTANITISPDRQRITIVLTTSGLTDVTAAHIHAGLSGASGLMGQDAPIVFPLFSSSQGSFPGTLVKNLTALDFTPQAAAGINTFADAVNAILQGRAYLNVHTQANPTGEIRGQILPSTFTTQLSGANEAPPTSSVGRGTATVTVNPATRTLSVNVGTALLSNPTVTLAHIHVGAVGISGPAIFPLFDSAQGPYVGTISKTLTATDLITRPTEGINNFNDAINAIITGNAYVNVHTQQFPGGDIRGQLVPAANQ